MIFQHSGIFHTSIFIIFIQCPDSRSMYSYYKYSIQHQWMICYGYHVHPLQSWLWLRHSLYHHPWTSLYILPFSHLFTMMEIVFAQKKFPRPYYISPLKVSIVEVYLPYVLLLQNLMIQLFHTWSALGRLNL